jgi:hypothetical protein
VTCRLVYLGEHLHACRLVDAVRRGCCHKRVGVVDDRCSRPKPSARSSSRRVATSHARPLPAPNQAGGHTRPLAVWRWRSTFFTPVKLRRLWPSKVIGSWSNIARDEST